MNENFALNNGDLEKPEEERMADAIKKSQVLGVPEFVEPSNLVSGNELLNYLFCAELFKKKHGLALAPVKVDYNREEAQTYAQKINLLLKDDKELTNYLPLSEKDLFNKSKNGIVLW